MNKIKVTLSEKTPPRIGDTFIDPMFGEVSVFDVGPTHVTFVTPKSDSYFRKEWLGLVVTRTEEEDGA